MILIMIVWLPKIVQIFVSQTTDQSFHRTSTTWNLHYDTNFASALELVILYGWMVHTSLGSTMMFWCFAIPSWVTCCLVKEWRRMMDSLGNIRLTSSVLLVRNGEEQSLTKEKKEKEKQTFTRNNCKGFKTGKIKQLVGKNKFRWRY